MIYSFDIFDTLITRKTATPKGIFAIMQRYLLKDGRYASVPRYIKENFYDLRVSAEVLAREEAWAKRGEEEVTLQDIYRVFLLTGSLSMEEESLLRQLELEVEYKCSIPVDANIKKLKEAYASSHKVFLVSDMYLDAEDIRKLLLKHDEVFRTVRIYVSSEYKKQKHTGSLFSVARDKERIAGGEWTHMGDNEAADGKGAEKAGICPQLYRFPQLMQFEKILLEAAEDNADVQLMVGTARKLRIGKGGREAYFIGSSFGGMLIFSYVNWVIEESLRKGIRNLYFIARDGYLLKAVADIMIQKRNYPIRTGYLYGSRKAWRMACFSEERTDLEKIIYYTDMEEKNDISKLAQIFQLPPEELETFLGTEKQEYTIEEIREAAGVLNRDEGFRRLLGEKHRDRKELLKEYLEQQINFREKSAFVEVSGSGMTQALIRDVTEEMGYESIPTFFMRIVSTDFLDDQIWAYMPMFSGNGYLTEAFCRAPHGITVGYEKKNGKVVPILNEMETPLLKSCGYEEYMDGVQAFAEAFAGIMEETGFHIAMEKVYTKLYGYLCDSPDKEILNFIGELPMEITGRGEKAVKLAPVLSDEEIEEIFLVRTYEPLDFFYKGSNLECSVRRCSEEQKQKINFCRQHRDDRIGNAARKKYHASHPPYLKKPPHMKERIALYAAGTWGQYYYWKLMDTCGVEVVAWVDKEYEKYRSDGLEVDGIEKLNECSCDQILVCVKKEALAEKIEAELVQKGVEKEKICWIRKLQF